MSDPWVEARLLRAQLVADRELARRTAIHAWLLGCLVGIVVGWMLGVGGGQSLSRKFSSDWIWVSTRFAIYERDGWRCYACGCTVHAGRAPTPETKLATIDHLVGSWDHRVTNLATMCDPCNVAKGCRTVREWRPELVPIVRKLTRRKLPRERGRELAVEYGYGRRLESAAARARLAAERRAAGIDVADFDPSSIDAMPDSLPASYRGAA
jgi:hypothetical protein